MTSTRTAAVCLPSSGVEAGTLREQMAVARGTDARWREGRMASLVYHASDDILAVAHEAACMFSLANGLGTKAFPSLQRFETEVVSMVGDLLGHIDASGNITSGGTESIMLAVRAAREKARAEQGAVAAPEMVLPVTAHPAFAKAADYMGITPVWLPIDHGFRADVHALERLLSPRTILVVASAPGFPHGTVDPVQRMAEVAGAHGIPLHVDACIGGFILPFIRELGYAVPAFDFGVQGVTSISVDLHKYAYCTKGASVILSRDAAFHRYHGFQSDDYAMGTYRTPTVAGTRPGGAIAASWAVLRYLGKSGYMRLASQTMQLTKRMMAGIRATPGLHIWGDPDASVFAYGAHDAVDIFDIASGLESRGWYVNRQREPRAIHLVMTPAHAASIEQYLVDVGALARGDRAQRSELAAESEYYG